MAISWLRQAAEQGVPAAQFSLGEIYYEGESKDGVERNELEAAKWLSKFLQRTNLDKRGVA